MDRWDVSINNSNIVVSDSISGEKVPITQEEQELILMITKTLYKRSMRYYIVIPEDGEQQPKHIDQHYMATAWLIYKAAKKLSKEIPDGGKGYGVHSLKTWIAIIMGPDIEPKLTS